MYKEVNDYEILYMISENNDVDYEYLIKKYEPLVNKYATKYLFLAKRCGLEKEDLKQIGYLSIYKAINYYKILNSNSLYTYLNKSIENNILKEIKSNSTYKKLALNLSFSYDSKVPNTNLYYYEILKDDKDYQQECLLNFNNKIISFKNTLEYELSCVFELLYNGYSIRETSILLNKTYYDIKRCINKIRRTFIYT